MTLQLRADVYMTEADGVLVFLDLARDRYCAVSRSDSGRLMGLLRDGVAKPDEPLLDRLRAAGLLEEAGGERPFAATLGSAPERSVSLAEPLGPIAAVRGALCRLAARRILRTKHIRDVVETRRARRKAARQRADEARLIRLAAQFAAGRPLAGGRNACLNEALALIFFLGRAGARADWVFGVKALPFAAHCWVQAGDLVLNDTAENVRNYTPIMIV
jgi:hypothetical protein